jgi:hypothetical protein
VTWEQIQTTLVGLAVSAIVAILGKWLGIKRAEETRSAVTWAIEQGVAYAAQKLKDARVTGDDKHREALKVAESLAPKAMSRLNAQEKVVLVDSTYAKMKASLPHPTTYSLSEGETPPSERVTAASALPPFKGRAPS